jgi:glycosyltransferase involved in cell wall biosynthesis
MNFKISYAITACSEHEELEALLKMLLPSKREDDEIVVQLDKENHTKKVLDVLKKYKIKKNLFKLDNDFASFKNNLKKICKGDYIFQIDADEIPADETVANLHKVLESNLDIDLFLVPRINIVNDITDEHLKKWNWKKDRRGWINWPDYQYRIFKNNFNIKWQNKVHENIVGAQTGVQLPATAEYALTHIKSIEKQESQNKLYEKL